MNNLKAEEIQLQYSNGMMFSYDTDKRRERVKGRESRRQSLDHHQYCIEQKKYENNLILHLNCILQDLFWFDKDYESLKEIRIFGYFHHVSQAYCCCVIVLRKKFKALTNE